MPFASAKQRRWMFKNHPEIAKRWNYEYKNTGGFTSGRSSDTLNRLRRWLDDPKLNDRERSLIMDAIGLIRQEDGSYRYKGGAVYKNIGGDFAYGAAKGIDEKVRKALDLGVPADAVYRTLRNNALRARNAQTRGTLLGAGLAGAGKAAANQAGLITQAGLNNQAFKPEAGALDAVGEGIKGAGDAAARYEGDLANISRQKFEDEIAAEERQYSRKAEARKIALEYDQIIEALQKTIKFAESALNQLAIATQVGTKDRSALQVWQDSIKTHVGGDILRGFFYSSETEKRKILQWQRDALAKAVQDGEITDAQANAMDVLVKRLINMAHAILSTQPGVKTDADFEFAKESVANLYSRGAGIEASLLATVKDAEDEIKKQREKKNAALGFAPKKADKQTEDDQGDDAVVQTLNVGGAVLPAPKSERDYNTIPAGASYVHPDGDVRIKS